MGDHRMMWIHALSPVHVGCGFGVGAVDLPITREKVTNWPMLPGSGIKGVLADHHGASEADKRESLKMAAFDKPDWKDTEGKLVGSNAGALVVGDARLVLLPVPSLYGTFAWVTCPLALRRLLRDLKECGLHGELGNHHCVPNENQILSPNQPTSKLARGAPATAYLSDLDLSASKP